MREEQPGIAVSAAWKLMAAEWKAMKPDEQKPYRAEFDKRKQLWEFDHPDHDAPFKPEEFKTPKPKPKAKPVKPRVEALDTDTVMPSPHSSDSEAMEALSDEKPKITLPIKAAYDWRRVDLRKKSTRRREQRRAQKARQKETDKVKAESSEGSSIAPSIPQSTPVYTPIAAKRVSDTHSTLVPLSRPANQAQTQASIFDMPTNNPPKPKPKFTYGKKPFFAARRTKEEPRRPKDGARCGYCQSLGHAGRHPESECRTRARHEQTAQSESSDERSRPPKRAKNGNDDTLRMALGNERVGPSLSDEDSYSTPTKHSQSRTQSHDAIQDPSRIANRDVLGAEIDLFGESNEPATYTNVVSHPIGPPPPADSSISWLHALRGRSKSVTPAGPFRFSTPGLPSFDEMLADPCDGQVEVGEMSSDDAALLEHLLSSQAT